MNTSPKFLLLLLMITAVFTACEKDKMDDAITIAEPDTYLFERDGASTVSFSGQTARIRMGHELIAAMKDFAVSETTMLEMFANETATGSDANPFSDPELNAETKSIRSKVAASNDYFSANTVDATSIKTEFASWISAQVAEVFPNENTLAAPGVPGQVADGTSVRYVNGGGLEYDQAFTKSLIGGLMADQALNNYLGTGLLDAADNRATNDAGTVVEGKSYTQMEHFWDEAYGYVYGTSADPTNPNLTIGQDDAFLNKYIGRVEDDADFTGIAANIWNAFKLGRAAIVAGDYEVRDQQANNLRALISTVIAARAVFYLQQGKFALENGDFGGGFHDLSEGFGFIYSLQFSRQPNTNEPYFTKAEVDAWIATLTDPNTNGFWEISPETLDNISEEIARKFDFTVAQAAE